MLEKLQTASSYQISQIKVYPDLNTIEVQGQSQRVEPKVMVLLNYLAHHQGEVCSKQSLIDAIWPNQIIADEALTRLIFVLRNALKDDAKSPQYIATVPKKGYVLLQPITLPEQRSKKQLLILFASLFIVFASLWAMQLQPSAEYNIIKSKPITFQEGREYGLVEGPSFSAYFHQYQGETRLMVAEQDGSYRQLVSDEWQKRSLQLIKNTLFYVRFNDTESQIVRHTLSAQPEVLFTSQRPIYHLSLNNEQQILLFTQYNDTVNTGLYQYSFIDKQVSEFQFNTAYVPAVIDQHFYDTNTDKLIFVGVQGRFPVIYGYHSENAIYQFEIKGFDSINSIALGKYENTLLVAGSYQLTRGIWSVNTVINEVTLVLNANDDVITAATMAADLQSVFYTLESHRQDIVALDWQGRNINLPELNSTLKEGRAQYSKDNARIFFFSDRSGDSELYQYHLNTYEVQQVTHIKASAIWHYSLSNDGKHLAIVYSTDKIELGIVDVSNGQLIQTTQLDEIKFPLAWSKDDQFIYVSEHRSQIAMYLYDSSSLTIKQKQAHLGLSAVEVAHKEIIAFDYTRDQFVRYNFDQKAAKPVSLVLPKTTHLAPHRVYVDEELAYIIDTNDDSHRLDRIQFAESSKGWRTRLLGEFNKKARIQSINPEQQTLLFSKGYSAQSGSIIELELQP